jgi:tRNA modification GTPase
MPILFNPADTIAAIATPPGTGAIAVIRLSGPHAFRIGDAVFHARGKRLSETASHQAVFGTIRKNKKILDEGLALVMRTPNSFTGEDTIEFSCHGSPYIQQEILNLLIGNGARMARPGEFTLRAFLNRKMDLAQAEAVGDVIAADSAASHELAIRQMRGGFSKEIHALRERLIHFASLLELELDFTEEDVEFADRGALISLIDGALAHMRKLSDSFEQGNVIKSGIPVAIAGKPNVGKSTLLNLILNEERAIVSEIAGTTRDTVEEEIFVGGIKYRFIDTAGIRETADTIEQIGVGRSLDKIRDARVIIYLFDPGETGPEELSRVLDEITAMKSGLNHILVPVANKTDRYNENYMTSVFSPVPDVIFISARQHAGIGRLLERITSGSVQSNLGSGDVVLTNIRHKESLDKTVSSLEQARSGLSSGLTTDLVAIEIRSALMHLGEITGEITTDDLLESIFTRFCIGK